MSMLTNSDISDIRHNLERDYHGELLADSRRLAQSTDEKDQRLARRLARVAALKEQVEDETKALVSELKEIQYANSDD